MEVAPSRVPDGGNGLFLRAPVAEGGRLGQFSGTILFSTASRSDAEDWALSRGDDRLVLLQSGGSWHVVDVRGSVFEHVNCSADEFSANMHVSPSGWCEATCDMCEGDELVWWYAELHSVYRVISGRGP